MNDHAALEVEQLGHLRKLLGELAQNPFYGPRLEAAGLDGGLDRLATFTARMPLTTKDEIHRDQQRHPPFGTNLTYPVERYVRFAQSSGTSGQPLRWLDTAESWEWMTEAWIRVFRAAGIEAGDRIFFAFSFGPFAGFWIAFDAARRMGCLALPGGGMSSATRLGVLLDTAATVLCCTPTYAIRLAEVAAAEGLDLARGAVRHLVVAGEPGGSVPAVRDRISGLWHGASVWDHHGMTEVGPVTYTNPRVPGVLQVIETSYLAEVLDPETLAPVAPGEAGELVLTTLGRVGSPLLRYRTGDLVRISTRSPEELGSAELALDGGILSRVDDMVVVRGVNLYPSAVDEVVRSLAGIAEYRVEFTTRSSMAQVAVRIEPEPGWRDPRALARSLEGAFRNAFQLRIPVTVVERDELPRFELKAKRWVKV